MSQFQHQQIAKKNTMEKKITRSGDCEEYSCSCQKSIHTETSFRLQSYNRQYNHPIVDRDEEEQFQNLKLALNSTGVQLNEKDISDY